MDQNADTEARTPVLMPRNGMVRALELDYHSNSTFFYDPIRRAIFQVKQSVLDDSHQVDVKALVPDDLSYVESLAYDWVSGNLYFSNLGRISVVRIQSPRQRRELLRQSQVNALAVDPNYGYLFYTSLSRPSKVHRYASFFFN